MTSSTNMIRIPEKVEEEDEDDDAISLKDNIPSVIFNVDEINVLYTEQMPTQNRYFNLLIHTK